jgi:hypothetical protein
MMSCVIICLKHFGELPSPRSAPLRAEEEEEEVEEKEEVVVEEKEMRRVQRAVSSAFASVLTVRLPLVGVCAHVVVDLCIVLLLSAHARYAGGGGGVCVCVRVRVLCVR